MDEAGREAAGAPEATGDGITVRADPSFIRFIYSFALDPERGSDGLDEVKRRASSAGWEDRQILSEYVLPHLASHLNAPRDRNDKEIGHWWVCSRHVPHDWIMSVSKTREIPLVLNSVEFVMFRTGVGMLVLDVDVDSDRIEDWLDALTYARFYRLAPPLDMLDNQDGAEMPTPGERDQARHGVFAGRSVSITPSDEPRPNGKTHRRGFGYLISDLLTDLFGGPQWERPSIPGLLIPYSAFFVDWNGATEDRQFAARYRWRRQLQSRSVISATTHDDLNATLRTYGEGMQFSYSVDGGGFFGGDLPREHFYQHELPEHVRRPYAFGFLLALHERLALGRFSERIGHAVAESSGSLPALRKVAELQDEFLEFLTRCRFVQVLRGANHHSNYREWETAFEVREFADEVETELRGLFERAVVGEQIADAKRARAESTRLQRASRRVNAAVLGISFPAVSLGVLAVAYPSGISLIAAAATALGSALLGVCLALVADNFRPITSATTDQSVFGEIE